MALPWWALLTPTAWGEQPHSSSAPETFVLLASPTQMQMPWLFWSRPGLGSRGRRTDKAGPPPTHPMAPCRGRRPLGAKPPVCFAHPQRVSLWL